MLLYKKIKENPERPIAPFYILRTCDAELCVFGLGGLPLSPCGAVQLLDNLRKPSHWNSLLSTQH